VLDINNHSIADIINPNGDSRFFIICEHASNHIPSQYQQLGLNRQQINLHIGWDIGARAVAEKLASILNAPLVLQSQSRLLYDCNRPTSAKSAIPEISESTTIPGNLNLSSAQKQARADAIYYPFHQSISDLLDRRQAKINSLIVTIHSFTPIYNGVERSLDLGIINDQDEPWAKQLTKAAQANSHLTVKLNQPYSASDGATHTLQLHGCQRQLPCVMMEIKNNLITSQRGQEKFAKLLAQLLQENLPNEFPVSI